MELVSVIMPNYNGANFIKEAIESVLAQTYQNWELLIVDDASNDNSNKIITKFIKQDSSSVRLIELDKNSGVAVARNKGIEIASGRYIAFLDTDDLWLPNKLEVQLKFMRDNDLPFTYNSYDLMGDNGDKVGKFITKPKITYESMLKTNSVGCLTAIYDTQKLGKVYIPTGLKRQEDYAMWLKILKIIGQARGLVEPSLAVYRISNNSLSSNKFKTALSQWNVYRNIEKLPLLKSIYCFMNYTISGILKYRF